MTAWATCSSQRANRHVNGTRALQRCLGGQGPGLRYVSDLGVRGGAGEGNRTLMTSLEGWSSTIELRPRGQSGVAAASACTHAYRTGLSCKRRSRIPQALVALSLPITPSSRWCAGTTAAGVDGHPAATPHGGSTHALTKSLPSAKRSSAEIIVETSPCTGSRRSTRRPASHAAGPVEECPVATGGCQECASLRYATRI